MFDSEHEKIELLLSLPADFPYLDLLTIGTMLEDAELLVPGYTPSRFGIYHPDSYLIETRLYETDFYVLPDRNIASRIVRVAKGGPIDASTQTAAALMAFVQCLDINFEPAIAFHELAHRNGNQPAQQELRWFRAADKARPMDWVAVATGEKKSLKIDPTVNAVENLNLSKPLIRWNRNYILALKIAELELEKSSAVQKALRLLEWMYKEFILGGPAFLFACLYFAPSAPRRRLLKQLRSPDRSRAIDGVKNAAWDLTHISDFVRRVHEGSERERYILATADKGLREIAATLVSCSDLEDATHGLEATLGRWWKSKHAEKIAEAYTACVVSMDDSSRHANQTNPPSTYIADLIELGEQRLIAWSP